MHGPVRRMRGNRLRRVFRCTPTDAPVGDGVPYGPHRRTFEYWRTLVYPSVGVGFYPARRLYFAFSFLPPAGIFRAPARHPFAHGGKRVQKRRQRPMVFGFPFVPL